MQYELKRLVYLIGACFHYQNAAQWSAWATLRDKALCRFRGQNSRQQLGAGQSLT
ncbi:hypothetical protein [Nitrosococcus wardiae]|uniref:hypothetical protein n=1 Tax=Nitrosococcus wardiae TaxID=1814290 RepID=UPI00141B7772|nr:hypothetical protein [Nitrosococcus wardiae]